MQGSGDSKPGEDDRAGGAGNGASDQIALNGAWEVMDARTVPASAVPEPTADAAALEISDVYIISTEAGSPNSIETAFATSIDSEDGYELVIEFDQEYYAYEVTEIWFELPDDRVIKWGDPISDDCDEFIDYYDQFPIWQSVPPLCTPKILNLSREFIGECAGLTDVEPHGSPPWRDQALWVAVTSGTGHLGSWEGGVSSCNSDPDRDCDISDTWQYFEWLFKYSVAAALDYGHYMCSFGTIPAKPVRKDPPIWASVPVDISPRCEEQSSLPECGGPQVKTVTVRASKPGGGNTVSNATLSGGIRVGGAER